MCLYCWVIVRHVLQRDALSGACVGVADRTQQDDAEIERTNTEVSSVLKGYGGDCLKSNHCVCVCCEQRKKLYHGH